jgi:hypothetical protein
VRRSIVTLLLSSLFVAAGLLVATSASACSCAGGTAHEQQGVVSPDSGAGGGLELTAGLEADLQPLGGTGVDPGPPAEPLPGAAGTEPAGSSVLPLVVAGAGVLALLLGAGLYVRRRHPLPR